jgi:ADP-heptose:LPS heptosyltransferase
MVNKTSFDRLSVIRALDQLLWPIALIASRLLAKIPRKQDKRFVIIRPGGMGDLICCQIALETLGLNPRDFIWVIESRSLPWVKMMNLEHHIIGPKLLLNVGRYRNVINTEQHYGASQIIAIALAGRGRQVSVFSTVRGSTTSTNICAYSPTRTHEIDSFLDLFLMANLPVAVNNPEVDRTQVSSDGSLLVALGGGHAESRALDIHSWIQTISKWTAGSQFSIIAGPVEKNLAIELSTHFGNRCTFLEGGFEDNCMRIAKAKRVLTIDGGLTHVATYFGTPTDTLFTSGQDLLWYPKAKGSRVFLNNQVKCRPCTMYGFTPRCPLNFECKSNIENFVLPWS